MATTTTDKAERRAIATQRYPALMAFIDERRRFHGERKGWYEQLLADEAEAFKGGHADVAAELARAQADYKAQEEAQGRRGFPYNEAMGNFLGLDIKPENHEPEPGYYMAGETMHHHRFGIATREVEALIAEGRTLAVVTARSKRDGKPVRCLRFVGPDQIKVEGGAVKVENGKYRGRLSSNWSVESCLEGVARAMRDGTPYGP